MKDHVVRHSGTESSASCTTNEASTRKKTHSHSHGSDCCDGHHHHRAAGSERTSLLGSILPILACALCPACIGVWAQVLSAVGMGIVVTEAQHHVLLAVAIGVTSCMSVYRYVRTRLVGPFVLTIAGCLSLGGSHLFAEENHILSWLSIAIILCASLWQRRAERRVSRQQHASSSDVAFDRSSGEVA